MNKILYEVSYIGNPRNFVMHLSGVIRAIGVLTVMLVWIHTLKEERKLEKEHSGNKCKGYILYVVQYIVLSIGTLVIGVIDLLSICGGIVSYDKVVLGYKKGEYREAEGIVEDYIKERNGYAFTINGIEFDVNTASSTWGYTYWKLDQNVITGDGQHLKIRYIPDGSNSIVYIEEIAEE